MNIVYVAYRKWALQILNNLLIENNDCKIRTALTSNKPEANFANLGIPFFQFNPGQLSETIEKKITPNFKPDLFLFYGWSWLIPKEIYQKYTCLVLHTSPLPKYRGGSPLQHQIINGETKSAVTIFKADGNIDTGDIYAQIPFSLKGSLDEIFKNIVKAGTKATIKVINRIKLGTIKPKPQNNNQSTLFKRRKPSESELKLKDFKTKTSEELYNFIRALSDPYPNAYIKCADGKKLFITGAKIEK